MGALEGDLAESWETTDENKTFVAQVREGLTITGGTPADPAAVQASFEYVAADGGSTADYADLTYEAIDDTTVSITWPIPQPVMVNKICSAKILPPSYLEAANWDLPVGSGPYVLDAAQTDGVTPGLRKKTAPARLPCHLRGLRTRDQSVTWARPR